MILRESLKAAIAGLALAFLAPVALGQAATLRYKPEAGQRRFYERTVRTEMIAQLGEQTRRTVFEVPVERRELVIETKADPPSMRVVVAESPRGQRLLVYEENGKDRLSSVPEADRVGPLPPILFHQWRDLRGQMTDKPATPAGPSQAMDIIQAEVRFLPDQPVKQGDSWSRDLDLGVAKASLTTRCTGTKTEGGKSCAILETSANITFTGEFATRLKIEKLTSRMAWALDGSGWVAHSGSMVAIEKADKVEQRAVRDFQEKLVEADRLDAAQLDKSRKDLAQIEKGMKEAQADDFDAALETLGAFARENPQGPWTPAVQNLYASLSNQKLVTKPVSAPRLRLMLRDLQSSRDQASAKGNTAQINQIDQTLRQVAGVNLKTLLEDSKDPDPIVRDLAAFGLAFAQDAEAANRLLAMVKDESTQVRGSVLIGLAIHGKGVEQNTLVTFLKDKEARVQGAAALLATRTLKKDDPRAAAVLPLLVENVKSANAWARMNTASALAALSPAGAVPSARALVDAYIAEKEERLRPLYLAALRVITGVEAKVIGPYEEWLKNPTTPAPAPAPKEAAPAPAPKEAAPAPAPKEATPAPAPKEATPAPAPKEATPAPAPKEATPAPAPKEATPAPAPKSSTPAPKG